VHTAPVLPILCSSTVRCSAKTDAFVAKVEKAGKVAFSGLAASALIASVRHPIPPSIVPAWGRDPA